MVTLESSEINTQRKSKEYLEIQDGRTTACILWLESRSICTAYNAIDSGLGCLKRILYMEIIRESCWIKSNKAGEKKWQTEEIATSWVIGWEFQNVDGFETPHHCTTNRLMKNTS